MNKAENEKEKNENIEYYISRLLEEKKKIKEMNLQEEIEYLAKDLPTKLQETIIEDVERWKALGIEGEELCEEVRVSVKRIQTSYESAICKLPNKGFAKYKMMDMINSALESDDVESGLKKIARISFDLNGLKAVNDLNGSHERGDDYLKTMAKALENEEVMRAIRRSGVCDNTELLETIITHDSGDEFSIVFKSDIEITQNAIGYIISSVKKTLLLEAEENRNVLDFTDEKVLLSFAGIDDREWVKKTEEEKQKILTDIKNQIPENYEFTAAVSGGGSTLHESLMSSDKKRVKDKEGFFKLSASVMGTVFDVSDKKMDSDKKEYKKELENGSEQDKFLLQVYSRTEGEKELRKEGEKLKDRIDNLNHEICTLSDGLDACEGDLAQFKK